MKVVCITFIISDFVVNRFMQKVTKCYKVQAQYTY